MACNIVETKALGVPTVQADSVIADLTDKAEQMNIRDSLDAEPIQKIHAKADMIKAFASVPGKDDRIYTD